MSQEGFAEPGRRGVGEVSTTESPHPTLGASRLNTTDSKSGGEKTRAKKLERETGIEPATNGLGSRDSTTELLPLARSHTILPQRRLSLPSESDERRITAQPRFEAHAGCTRLLKEIRHQECGSIRVY